MFAKSLAWVRTHLTPLQAASLIMAVALLAGAFALGAFLGNVRQSDVSQPDSAPQQAFPPDRGGHKLGSLAAIERVDGDRIQLRDPRSGRSWSVRANPNTVVEFGPRRRIPLGALRPGQRVFVVGIPDTPAWNQVQGDLEWDAQFIGVVAGTPQRYLMPPRRWCPECKD